MQTKELPSDLRKVIQETIEDLKSRSILENGETITEGFCNVWDKSKGLYSFHIIGFITQKRLILAQFLKGRVGKLQLQDFLQIPFDSIEGISISKEKNKRHLITCSLSMPVVIVEIILLFLPKIEVAPAAWVIYWIIMIIFSFFSILGFALYFRGDKMLDLNVGQLSNNLQMAPRFTLKLRCFNTLLAGYQDVFLFNFHEENLENESIKIKIEELGQHLKKYTRMK